MKKYFNYKIEKSFCITNLKTIETLDLEEGFSYPFEMHDFHEFVYVFNGNLICENSQNSVNLTEGDFKLISPKTSHRYLTTTNANIFIVCFKCSSNAIDILNDRIELNPQEKELIIEILNEAKNAFEFPFVKKLVPNPNAEFGSQQLTQNLIEELFILLMRNKINKGEIQLVQNNLELQNNLVNDIIALLKENLYGRITLTEICRKIFYSNTYLNKIFKNNKGITIMQYYDFLKIEEAKKLIKKGLTNVTVSDRLCYDNPNYFAKVFKKYTGKTPTTFRSSFKK